MFVRRPFEKWHVLGFWQFSVCPLSELLWWLICATVLEMPWLSPSSRAPVSGGPLARDHRAEALSCFPWRACLPHRASRLISANVMVQNVTAGQGSAICCWRRTEHATAVLMSCRCTRWMCHKQRRPLTVAVRHWSEIWRSKYDVHFNMLSDDCQWLRKGKVCSCKSYRIAKPRSLAISGRLGRQRLHTCVAIRLHLVAASGPRSRRNRRLRCRVLCGRVANIVCVLWDCLSSRGSRCQDMCKCVRNSVDLERNVHSLDLQKSGEAMRPELDIHDYTTTSKLTWMHADLAESHSQWRRTYSACHLLLLWLHCLCRALTCAERRSGCGRTKTLGAHGLDAPERVHVGSAETRLSNGHAVKDRIFDVEARGSWPFWLVSPRR